jgi:mRNA interferase MazF
VVVQRVRRGEVWTVAAGKGYAGKPRPVVIVQDDAFDATDSITVCGLTTNPAEAPLARVAIEPSEGNGLNVPCRLMVDKITTVPKSKLGRHLGRLASEDILRMNRGIVVFLGLAG